MGRILFLIFIQVFITSCLESEAPSESKSGGGSTDTYSPVNAELFEGDLNFKEDISSEIDVRNFLNLGSGSYVFSKLNGPSWITIDATTGIITGSPTSAGEFSASFRAVKIGDVQDTGSLSIAVNGDPLKDYSWHLVNTGQKSFASRSGTSGYDINLQSVHGDGVTGSGVKVVVSDTGVEVNHDDLINNMMTGFHKNYTGSSPYYGNPVASTAHGTAVSGIIAAEGWNNMGSIGIAPKAKLAAYQFLDSSQSTSILIDQASGNFDIFNYSYGDVIYYDTLSDSDYIDHLRWATVNQRSGLGTFHVKAAGNEFINLDDYNNPSVCAAHNANAPFENESPYMIIVGAINADGQRASYSNAGSNLWVSAPGGEYGAMEPAIVTTDLPTCFKGYSKADNDITNDFEYGHSLNQKCNYTSTMNGTSSSAPVVSGAIALILDANPNLSLRDVKHILAVTAEKVDPSITAWPGKNHPSNYIIGCPDLSLNGHSYEQDWITNNAGLHFHNFYGFGNIDISAAVAMAKNTVTDPLNWIPLPARIETNTEFSIPSYDSGVLNTTITDNNSNGISSVMNITNNLNVEQVQIKVIITHPRSGEVGLELTSPNGTKSILKYVNDSFLIDDDANLNMVLLSNAFYGESSQGNWTLKVIDGKNGNIGILSRWKMNIIGHTP